MMRESSMAELSGSRWRRLKTSCRVTAYDVGVSQALGVVGLVRVLEVALLHAMRPLYDGRYERGRSTGPYSLSISSPSHSQSRGSLPQNAAREDPFTLTLCHGILHFLTAG